MTKSELNAQAIASLKRRAQIQIKIRQLNAELLELESFLSRVDAEIAHAPDDKPPTSAGNQRS